MEWRIINGFENYVVSENGQVRNTTSGKMLEQTITQNGYATVALFDGERYRNCRVHRLVAMAFVNNPDNKPQVNHIDGNKMNNNIKNLEWATGKENVRHSYFVLGRGNSKGANKDMPKCKNDGWNIYRKNLYMFRLSRNLTQLEFSELMGVSRTAYSNVESGRRDGELSFWLALQNAFSVPDSEMWALLKLDRRNVNE